MNANDMVERGWKSRQRVSITSHFNGETRHADDWMLIPYDIPSGNLAGLLPGSELSRTASLHRRCIEYTHLQMDCMYTLGRAQHHLFGGGMMASERTAS